MARIEELTDGLSAYPVVETVVNREFVMQAIRSTPPGGHLYTVGVSHGVELPGQERHLSELGLGGPAPVRHDGGPK